jgi:hypothetical protein
MRETLVFVINPSKIFDILEGKEEIEGESAGRTVIPRYFLEIDSSIRRSTHFREWIPEKELEIVVKFEYVIDKDYSVFLVLRGRPDFYDPRQGVVLELKKQPFESKEMDRFEKDVQKAWTQVGLYAFMLYALGFNIEAAGVQFLWPGETQSNVIVIGGWEIPVPESIEQVCYCDVVPFTEDDVAEVKNMLWNLGLTLLLKQILKQK